MNNIRTGIVKSLFILIIILIQFSFLSAQTFKSVSKKKEEDKKELKDKLWYGINFGNFGFSNNQIDIRMSLAGGYKINKAINVGLILHGDYGYYWTPGPTANFSNFDYGFGGLANVKFFRSFFAQVELDRFYLKQDIFSSEDRKPYLFSYVGVGYKYQSGNNWSGIVTLLINLNTNSNLIFPPLEYRFGFCKNF